MNDRCSGPSGWRVRSRDAALQASFEATGVVSHVAPLSEPPGHFTLPTLDYNSRTKLLRYAADNNASWTPTPQRFTELMEMLIKIAAINARLNPGP